LSVGASTVVEKGLVSGFMFSILTKTPQLVLLFCLRSRNIAYVSTSPSYSLIEAEVVSLATAFETQGGNSPVSLTWRLKPSPWGLAAAFCL